MKKKLQIYLIKLSDYFFLLRPIVLIPIWFFFILGHWHAKNQSALDLNFVFVPDYYFIICFFLYTLVGGGIYVINQIYDKETDYINRKLFLISDGYISVRSAWIYLFFLFTVPLISSWFMDQAFFIIISISVLMGFLYSAHPFHFKGRPVLDMLSNALGNGLVNLGAGYVIGGGRFSLDFVYTALPYMCATGAVYLNTTVADIEGDKKAGDRTSGVVFGTKKTGLTAFILLLIALIVSAKQLNMIAFFPSLISLPFFIKAYIKDDIPQYISSTRICTLLIALFVGVFYPWFILFLILIVGISRFYYLKRFNLRYPKIFTKDHQ